MPDTAPDDIKRTHKHAVPGTVVPKAFLRPMGYLAIWSSNLEMAMDNAIYFFFATDDPNKGFAVTAKFNTLGNKLDFLKVVADLAIKNAKARSAFKKICDDADTVVAQRNKLIHGRWMGGSGRNAMKVTYKAQSKLTFSSQWFTPEQVKQTGELALGVSDRLLEFFARHPNWAQP